MNCLIKVIQLFMNSNNAPVQLIKTYLNDVRKKYILVVLQNKTNTDMKTFFTLKAHHIQSKYNNHQSWLLADSLINTTLERLSL